MSDRGLSALQVSAPAPAVGLGPELTLELHEAPDSGAVSSDVWLNVGGQRMDGGQVDAEQLAAVFQRRRDRPAQVRVVPSPHGPRVSNTSSTVNRERCVVRRAAHSRGGPHWGRNWAEPGGQQRTAGDNKPRGQQPFRGEHLGCEIAGPRFHTAEVTGSKPVRPTRASDQASGPSRRVRLPTAVRSASGDRRDLPVAPGAARRTGPRSARSRWRRSRSRAR
jgi:hypothetical protein